MFSYVKRDRQACTRPCNHNPAAPQHAMPHGIAIKQQQSQRPFVDHWPTSPCLCCSA